MSVAVSRGSGVIAKDNVWVRMVVVRESVKIDGYGVLGMRNEPGVAARRMNNGASVAVEEDRQQAMMRRYEKKKRKKKERKRKNREVVAMLKYLFFALFD